MQFLQSEHVIMRLLSSEIDAKKSRPLGEDSREQISGHGKAKQLEIPTVRDFERLRRFHDRKISRPADLFVIALRIAGESLELKIDEAHVIDASRDVRTQT